MATRRKLDFDQWNDRYRGWYSDISVRRIALKLVPVHLVGLYVPPLPFPDDDDDWDDFDQAE